MVNIEGEQLGKRKTKIGEHLNSETPCQDIRLHS